MQIDTATRKKYEIKFLKKKRKHAPSVWAKTRSHPQQVNRLAKVALTNRGDACFELGRARRQLGEVDVQKRGQTLGEGERSRAVDKKTVA